SKTSCKIEGPRDDVLPDHSVLGLRRRVEEPAARRRVPRLPARGDAVSESRPEKKDWITCEELLAASDYQATRDTLRAMLSCCESWEPDTCIMGNVRSKDAAKALRAVLLAAVRPSDDPWLPFDTAPQDGTRILTLHNEVAVTSYRVQRDDCEMWVFGRTMVAVDVNPKHRPSHWMPHPPLRAAGGEG
ncbi:hypothetical protein, partial [Luteitalea sp.]|uniref:hypothetical protein n=1 Tax=Luteitalea sp. TaxID=2004800 RepID=UPI0025BF6C25